MQILAQLWLFEGLSGDELTRIDERMVSRAFEAGDHICAAGNPAEFLFVVAAGQAKAFKSAPSGRDVIVDVMASGDLFGGLRLLGRTVYGETVEALTAICVLRFGTEQFRQLLVEHPSVALRMLDNVTASLGNARTDAGQLASLTVTQRVAATLLRLVDQFGHGGGETDGTLIHLPLSRADLAQMTGSTPESVSRVMSGWRRDGIIDSGRRWTAVLDSRRLTDIVGQERL